MSTFLTDLMKKGYAQDKIFAEIFESELERKRRRVHAIVIETVATHRLKKIREFLAYQELATWRRMNGFDRVADGEDNWFHGPHTWAFCYLWAACGHLAVESVGISVWWSDFSILQGLCKEIQPDNLPAKYLE